MKYYIKQLQQWTREGWITWEYLPTYGNLFGKYIDGDVSLCRLIAGNIYYKLTVNSYAATDGGTSVFYVMDTHPYFTLVEEVRTMAIRRSTRIKV